MPPNDDRPRAMVDNPLILFELFQTDELAAEIDWDNERVVFYPVDGRYERRR